MTHRGEAGFTLTVASRWGLANRLRTLISGLVLARASGRTFTMLWSRTPDCAALFHELFTNDLAVRDEPIAPSTPIYCLWPDGPQETDFLRSTQRDIFVLTPNWVLRPRLFPAHEPLMQQCGAVLEQLVPVPDIGDRVAAFQRAHFRPTMIGVHLRRGDYTAVGDSDNLDDAMRHVDGFLRGAPEAGIFLATDDGAPNQSTGRPTRPQGIRERFLAAYGDRVVSTTPRSLDRRQPEAVQDALADLLLLRQTQMLVGTRGSSFSGMAAFGRAALTVFCGQPAWKRRRAMAVRILTGVYPLVKLLGWLQFRRDVPAARLRSYYAHRARLARRRAAKAVQRQRHRAVRWLDARAPRLANWLRRRAGR